MDTVFNTSCVFSIPPRELARRLGRPDSPLLLDVRRETPFQSSHSMLPGAVRCLPEDVAIFASTQTPREVVAYCVYGHNVSAEAVVQLRSAGWDATALEGGIEGGEPSMDDPQDIARWRASGLPHLVKRPDWGVTGAYPSRWITRERPKIDRIACPWLIRRFVDPPAEFFYVPTPQVLAEAARLDAVAYDIPGAPVSHAGEHCSFDALLHGFGLDIPALNMLATIVRGADTDRLDLAPQAAGLLALSLGLSRLHADDDLAMREAAMPVYDALYAWCTDKAQATDEQHTWKPEAMIGSQP